MCLECDVVIVNYDAGELLSACVASILHQGVSKVIVVDNASTDDSLMRLDSLFFSEDRLEIIRNERNVGFSSACNIGAKRSEAEYILFLNPDCVVGDGAISHLINVLEEGPRVGMAGGLLLNPDGTEQAGGRRVMPTPRRAFVRAFGLSWLGKIFPRLFSDFLLHREPLPEKPVEVEAISGACMLVKRSVMDKIGFWDEEYFMHCEDLDLCMRFRSYGWKILFVPEARIVHEGGGCSYSRPLLIEWHKHKGMVRFYRKYFRNQYPGLLMWLVIGAVWMRFSVLVLPITLKQIIRARPPKLSEEGGPECGAIRGKVER